jgi:hypothetical protein
MSDSDETDIQYGVLGSSPFDTRGKQAVSIFTWARTNGPGYKTLDSIILWGRKVKSPILICEFLFIPGLNRFKSNYSRDMYRGIFDKKI